MNQEMEEVRQPPVDPLPPSAAGTPNNADPLGTAENAGAQYEVQNAYNGYWAELYKATGPMLPGPLPDHLWDTPGYNTYMSRDDPRINGQYTPVDYSRLYNNSLSGSLQPVQQQQPLNFVFNLENMQQTTQPLHFSFNLGNVQGMQTGGRAANLQFTLGSSSGMGQPGQEALNRQLSGQAGFCCRCVHKPSEPDSKPRRPKTVDQATQTPDPEDADLIYLCTVVRP